MKTYAEQFASWANSLDVKSLDEDLVKNLKFLLKDICGLVISARNEDYVQSLVKTYKNSGNIFVLGHKEKFDLSSSAIISGTSAHGEDYDDTFEGNPMHVGASMISMCLSAGQYFNLSGEQLIKSLVVGGELMCRLALVAPTAMHKQGFHPTAICGTFGVTAGIASVLNLSDKQFASALGIAGSLSSGIIEYLAEGTSTKRLHPGWATSSGMQAAMIAKNNFAGPRTVFEGDHGFFNSFAKKDIDRNFNELTNDLGKVYHVKNLAFKPFACGTMTQPFIDCAVRLKEKIGDISKIKKIKALVGEGTVHRLWEPISEKRNPSSAYSAKFSTPYCIAIGLLKGKAGLAEFDEKNINDQEILKLTQIIEYEIDPDDEYPKNYSGTLVVETEEGQIIEKQACLRGGKKQPLVFKDIDQKFNDNLSFGKLSNDETKKLNIFIESFFDKPDYSKINLF